jgi:pimeloyl-ACP methyl ester carboxylesterase
LIDLSRGNVAEAAGALAGAQSIKGADLAKAMRQGLWVFVLFVSACLQPVSATGREPGPEAGSPGSPPAALLACDPDGLQASGAVYRICMPSVIPWNGDLFVYAHGYVSPTEPVGIPEDQMILPGGLYIADIVNVLGYGFATTSYSTNGLAVVEGMADLADLVNIFAAEKGVPNRVLLVGVSEGGLITTLSVEQRPDLFDGGLAMCGPYGDFRRQVDYIVDHRVVFDYFFPGAMPDSPVDIPAWLLTDWDTYYQTTVRPEIEAPANAGLVDQLLNVSQAAYDPGDPATREEIIHTLLWYNVFATNDARERLVGQPFDNLSRIYTGSDDDGALNLWVQRFAADQAALDEIDTHYQTSGILAVPLVTLHTTGDPLVPYWQATRYRSKTMSADNIALHEHLAVERYGHCTFTFFEVLSAFYQMVDMVENPTPYRPVRRSFLPSISRIP